MSDKLKYPKRFRKIFGRGVAILGNSNGCPRAKSSGKSPLSLNRRAFQWGNTARVRLDCSRFEAHLVTGSASALPSPAAPLPVWVCSGPGTQGRAESVGRTWTVPGTAWTRNYRRNKAITHRNWKRKTRKHMGGCSPQWRLFSRDVQWRRKRRSKRKRRDASMYTVWRAFYRSSITHF